MVRLYVRLLLKPAPRGVGIGDALVVRTHRAIAARALVAEPARAVALGVEHNEAGLDEELRPVAIFDRDGTGGIHQAGAIMHADDGRKRPIAVGAVDGCLQGDVAVAKFDRLRTAGRGIASPKQKREQGGRSKRRKATTNARESHRWVSNR